MNNYEPFKTLFLTKSNAVLLATIAASQKRAAAFSESGNAASEAVELNRIQAAADVLDGRGYYSGKVEQKKPDNVGQLSMGKRAMLIAAVVGVWYLL